MLATTLIRILLTDIGSPVKANSEKNLVVVEIKTEAGEGKSEEKVLDSTETSSTDGSEASQPISTLETPIIDPANISTVAVSSLKEESVILQEDQVLTMTIYTKKEFADLGHLKSGNYYLPKSPMLSQTGKKSGLFSNLNFMSFLYPCGTTYQCCYPTVPMIRFESSSINDLSPIRMNYWDTSVICNRWIPCGV